MPLLNRRRFLVLAAGSGAAGLAGADESSSPIAQPSRAEPAAFMQRAEEMRRLAVSSGDQGYGAVVVKDGKIVGQAPSRVVVNGDPTAHAETEAIRDACRRLGTRNLSGCILYSTTAACAMCETAAYWANIGDMYAGSSITPGGTPRYGGC